MHYHDETNQTSTTTTTKTTKEILNLLRFSTGESHKSTGVGFRPINIMSAAKTVSVSVSVCVGWFAADLCKLHSVPQKRVGRSFYFLIVLI